MKVSTARAFVSSKFIVLLSMRRNQLIQRPQSPHMAHGHFSIHSCVFSTQIRDAHRRQPPWLLFVCLSDSSVRRQGYVGADRTQGFVADTLQGNEQVETVREHGPPCKKVKAEVIKVGSSFENSMDYRVSAC